MFFEALIPMVIAVAMFAMIFGIIYVKSRENMAMIEKGLNPKTKDVRPRPFVNLKYGLLLMGSGLGLLLAFIVHVTLLRNIKGDTVWETTSSPRHRHWGAKQTITVNTNAVRVEESSGRPDSGGTSNNSAVADSIGRDADDNNGEVFRERHYETGAPAIYFALIAIGGGLGLFLAYRIEKKEWWDKQREV